MEGGTVNGNNLNAKFAKGAKFRRGKTGNGNNLNAEGAEVSQRDAEEGFQALCFFLPLFLGASEGGRACAGMGAPGARMRRQMLPSRR